MIVGVSSWRGTGATTLATLLAAALAARGESPWLIEADPAGGVLGARLDVPGGSLGGLEQVAFPEGRAVAGSLAEDRFASAATMFGGTRLVTTPGEPFRAWACHLPRLPWAPLLRELDDPVIVDLGRMRGGAPHATLQAQLDVLLLVSTADVVSLVASIEWASSRGRVSPSDPGLALDITRIVVVDTASAGGRVSRTEAEAELGDRFAGWLPWAPAVVDLVERGAPLTDRRLRRQPLVHAVGAVADRVSRWVLGEAAA